ncbi:MAG TPA: protein kinase family protein [Mycobacteriales bacterium]|nr:protein kinase family protein [Mycobacteriales bacterium]
MPPRPAGRSNSSGLALLTAGDVLAQRYRLLAPVLRPGGEPEAQGSSLWHARDEVLARPVALTVISAAGRSRPLANAVLAAAGRAGTLAHPGLTRVYDAAIETTAAGPVVAYLVSEWVDGTPLSEALDQEGPLPPSTAAALAVEAGEAVAAAHAAGVMHGRLHPGNMMLTREGRLRVTGAAVAAALHKVKPTAAGDVRDLAACLYAMLTGRWPVGSTQDAAGVPLAPPRPEGGGSYSPRQLRAGVPRALDAVVARSLDPTRVGGQSALTTARAFVTAVEKAATEARGNDPRESSAKPRRPSLLRRFAFRLVALGVVALVGVVGYAAGRSVGALPSRHSEIEELVQDAPSASPGATTAPVRGPIDLRAKGVVVRDFDPHGDGEENADAVPNAIDRDSSTIWQTDAYRSANLVPFKGGVGLLVDLGRPTALQEVQVGFVRPGARVELRTGLAPGVTEDSFRVVATVEQAGAVATLRPGQRTTGRYWLVWLTKLPADGRRFRASMADLNFVGAG